MAIISSTSMTGSGLRALPVTTLGASDTLTYDASKSPILILNNVSAGALTPNIDGDGGTTVPCAGVGDVDVSSGITLASIAAGDYVAIPLNSISGYLSGVVTVTGGLAIEACILEF